ncbi:hypothetical protein BH11BAC2_BH11BAC2_24510 [soil metagenome]
MSRTLKSPLKFILIFFLMSAFHPIKAQQASIIKLAELTEIINRNTDTVYVLNFWATWCKPCVAELPGFISVASDLQNSKLKFYFISLDFKREFESRLIPFLEKQSLPGPVYLLDEPDYNSWINLIEPTWQGSIPATLIISKNVDNHHQFIEGEITPEDLKRTLILKLLKP